VSAATVQLVFNDDVIGIVAVEGQQACEGIYRHHENNQEDDRGGDGFYQRRGVQGLMAQSPYTIKGFAYVRAFAAKFIGKPLGGVLLVFKLFFHWLTNAYHDSVYLEVKGLNSCMRRCKYNNSTAFVFIIVYPYRRHFGPNMDKSECFEGRY
jgi:hypothetical protein